MESRLSSLHRGPCRSSTTPSTTLDTEPKLRMANYWIRISFAVGFLIGSPAWGYKILAFFPYPAKSHHAVIRPLVQELARRGHEITYFTPFPSDFKHPNYNEVINNNFFLEMGKVVNLRNFNNMWSLEGLRSLQSLVKYTAVKIFTDPEVQRLIESDRKFDAVMDMSTIIQGPAAVLQHRFNAVGIEVIPLGCSYWTEFLLGGAINPSYMMDYSSAYTDRMTFVERFINTLSYMGIIGMYNFFVMPVCQAIADQHMRYPGWETRPSLTELTANKSLAIINTHFSLNYPFPRPPHFIEVAGMNVQPNKPLPKDLQESMDGATDGVIYLSLGTNIEVSQFLEGHLLKSFTNVLGNLKQKIIWKWESDIFPNKPDNVITAKWLPQQDILAHKNCKLFITQGGFMSLSETVYNSVPVLGIPLMGDQRKNMVHASSKGYGILLEVENITESSFSWAVNEILYNPSYREAMKVVSEVFKDRPMTAVDTAVYWIEYAIRHRGAPHLKTAPSRMPWYQTVLLDVVAAIVAVVAVIGFIVFLALKMLFWLIFGKGTTGQKMKAS